MEPYSTYLHAVINLHERGFTEDFIQSGDKLSWIQQQALFPWKDAEVLERYRFSLPGFRVYTVLGVVLKSVHVKGILLCRQLTGKRNNPIKRKQVRSQTLYRSKQLLATSL